MKKYFYNLIIVIAYSLIFQACAAEQPGLKGERAVAYDVDERLFRTPEPCDDAMCP